LRSFAGTSVFLRAIAKAYETPAGDEGGGAGGAIGLGSGVRGGARRPPNSSARNISAQRRRVQETRPIDAKAARERRKVTFTSQSSAALSTGRHRRGSRCVPRNLDAPRWKEENRGPT